MESRSKVIENTLTFNIRLFCLSLCLMAVASMPAQNELASREFPLQSDTTSVKPIDNIEYNQLIQPSDLSRFAYPSPEYEPLQLPGTRLDAPLFNTPAFVYHAPNFTPGSAVIAGWHGGAFTAGGHIDNMPGLMGISSGQLGIGQQFGNLTLYVGGVANKYGYFGGLHTQYGLEASAGYSLSPRWSINAQGRYYPGNNLPTMPGGLIAPMSVMGYFQTTQLRLTTNYQVNDWFEIEAGGKVERRYGTNQYETLPVVTPYFSLGSGNRKVRIGVPVGEIMYKILRSYTGRDNRGGNFNFRTAPPGPILP